MITVAEITEKARRRYASFLTSYLQGRPFIPLGLPVGKLPTDLETLRREGMALKKHSKTVRGYGYEITWVTRQTRGMGQQDFPEQITIPTSQDYLRLISKEREFALFENDVAVIRERLPTLEVWIQTHPQLIIDNHNDWTALLEVCHY